MKSQLYVIKHCSSSHMSHTPSIHINQETELYSLFLNFLVTCPNLIKETLIKKIFKQK